MNQTIFHSIPFVRTHMSTENIMFLTVLSLLPSAGYGMYLYGLHAALLMGISVVTAVAAEGILSLILRRGLTIQDYSAVVTGLIGGMLLPARAPLYFAVILPLIAIVSKAAFGGIGRNILNPAGLGNLVLLIAFHSIMLDFSGGEYGQVAALTAIKGGEEITLGSMLAGHVAGPIGTGSAVTILLGAAVLLLFGVTDIWIPLADLAAFSIFWILFGGYGLSPYWLGVQLAGGSFLFTAFYMAQDHTTSPMSTRGKVIHGVILGLLTGVLRRCGVLESGALIALLAANCPVRWLDTKTLPVSFGVDATVRKVVRRRRRRQPINQQDIATSAQDYQEFEEHVVPRGAMDGSETAGTIDADAMESLQNRRAVTYDTASLDPAEVRRQLRQQEHKMKQSMPIFGEPAVQPKAPAGEPVSRQQTPQPTRRQPAATRQQEASRPSRRQSAAQESAPQPVRTGAPLEAGMTMPYSVPMYANGQPMFDVAGNPLPLLDANGNPVLDAYGNMIWGQPMLAPNPYTAPATGVSQRPAGRSQVPLYHETAETAPAGQRDRNHKKAVSDEPVSRDTDFIEVARILEAERAREKENAGSALKNVQYMDLTSPLPTAEIRKAADQPEHHTKDGQTSR